MENSPKEDDYLDQLVKIPISHMLKYIAASYHENYSTDTRALMETDAQVYSDLACNPYVGRVSKNWVAGGMAITKSSTKKYLITVEEVE